jgi:hypothetical protein
MSNHFSAADLKFPGDDARLDFTDLFVFAEPADQGKTVLIMDVDPLLTGSEFHPDAVYRINIDNDGDALADAAFSLVFSDPKDGPQTATVLYTTGTQAELPDAVGEVLVESAPVGFDGTAQPVQAGPVRLFTGVRSDPFFADADGALHGFQWTGQDTFAGKNILSMALDVPNDMLGPGPEIGVWATTSLHRDGQLIQMDRGGHPTINPFINPDDQKDEYNARQPVDDLANYLEPWSQLLEDKGGYSHDEAVAKVKIVLPDILRYNRDEPASYPNGRVPTDDVYSQRFAWLTNGKVGPDGLKPHADLMPQFPFLGLPNP